MPPTRHRFGPFELREDEHRLLRGGEEVEIQPAAFELLVHFARNPGVLLTREALLSAAWSVHVSDQSLSQMVRRLRVALDEHPTEPVYLETVRGRGYRFRLPPPTEEIPQESSIQDEPSAFVGRVEEVRALAEALGRHRLVTLMGPGGIGKTRLARRVLAGWKGVATRSWWIDLQAVADRAGIIGAIWEGRALGDAPGADPLAELARVLGDDLLVLDNAEQVVDEVGALVGRLLTEAPRVRILVTSRFRLGIQGERCLELGPLELPDALALLRDRAEAVRLGLGDLDEEVGRRIVEQLEGLPLALVLAAPGLLLMSANELHIRLGQRLLWLGSPGKVDRASSLEASIRWSWELLDEPYRVAAVACAIFRGGFGLCLAEAVVQIPDLPHRLMVLRDRSILQEVPGPGPRRLRMLQPVRDWMFEQLRLQGELAAVSARHARALAADWADEARYDACTAQVEDLRFALSHAPDEETRARLALLFASASLEITGPSGLAGLLDGVVEGARGGDPELLGALLCQRGWLRGMELGEREAAVLDLQEALRLGQRAGLPRVEARALSHLGVLEQHGGARAQAVRHHAAGVEVCRRIDWSWGLARALAASGHALWKISEVQAALPLLEEAVVVARRAGARRWEAFAQAQLADIAYSRGDVEAHGRHARAVLDCAQAGQDRKARRWAAALLSRDAAIHGRLDEAEAHAREALAWSAGGARAGALMRLVLAILAREDLQGALEPLAEAELVARQAGQIDHLGWAIEVRSAVEAALGRVEVALEKAGALWDCLDGADPSDSAQVTCEVRILEILAGRAPSHSLPTETGSLRATAMGMLALARLAEARADGRADPAVEAAARPRQGESPSLLLLRRAVDRTLPPRG